MFSISASSSDSASSCGAHERRDGLEAGELRRAPAALAGDQLVASRRAPGARAPAAARRARAASRPARAARPRRSSRRGWRGFGVDQLDRDVAQLALALAALRAGRREDRRQAAAHAARALSHVRPPPWPARSRRPSPAQCGSWWMTGRPKLGASPRRTLRGITVSNTSAGKCSRTSRSTSWPSLRAVVVHRQQHPGDGQPRVELALDQRQRVEQPGEALRARSTRSAPGRSRGRPPRAR